jgi:hypothetical protein
MNVRGNFLGGEINRRGEWGTKGVKRIKYVCVCVCVCVCIHTHTCEESIMKPTKHCLKKVAEEKGKRNIRMRRTCSKYTVWMYRIIVMKSPHIINVF